MSIKNTSNEDIQVFEFGGKSVSKISLPDFMLVKTKSSLLAQAIFINQKRSYIRRAHTKQRAEVRGGGKKPWKQKGTGRSRHGSSRSPLWVGGGITFGPRSHKRRSIGLPKTMAKQAFKKALNEHILTKTLKIIRFDKELPKKAKEVSMALAGKRGVLLIVANESNSLLKIGRNVKGLKIVLYKYATVTDLVRSSSVWLDEKAIPYLQDRVSSEH